MSVTGLSLAAMAPSVYRRFSQRVEQRLQPVVIQFLHQCQQAADFAGRKSLAGEPVQIVAGQVGDQPALVFAEGHLASDQQEKIVGIHGAVFW